MKSLGIVAGELSGDRLGAGLIRELRKRYPDLRVEGIGGPQMQAEGARSLYPMEPLAVMGIGEILRQSRALSRAYFGLRRHFLADPPDVFVGIDAPEFNLRLEPPLHRAGIRTAHYVSPQVWAWRKGRVRKIARSLDLMLTLFPFEAAFYRQHGVPVCCVGHPLADEIPLRGDQAAARRQLKLPQESYTVALLPGSRANEWHYHVAPFIRTALWLRQRSPKLDFIVAASSLAAKAYFVQAAAQLAPALPFNVVVGSTAETLTAADVVLTVSGTATLNTLLAGRPMVVAYRMGALSYRIARLLIDVPFISLPNLLAGQRLVPEFIQAEVEPEKLGPAVLHWLEHPDVAAAVCKEFTDIHRRLSMGGSRIAADAVAALCA